ncbi:MAG: MMPL family transporter, partial [Bacteroidales bacterium]|nr:MMPL family transporter [Bacteroidales bacterium]
VTLLVGLIFRSFQAGLLSLIPLGMATLILFGLMGWLGIRLDAATTLLSSVMIGVGVDYTIHYLWRHRDEIRSGKTHPEAIVHTLPTTGKGIAFNALSVMVGFSVLIFSAFNPIRFFGFLVVISILACLAGAMLIIPAACQIWKPRFFEHQKKQ